jgi:hypothetical protein
LEALRNLWTVIHINVCSPNLLLEKVISKFTPFFSKLAAFL